MIDAAFVIDPIDSLNTKKDTTIAMMCAAKELGWNLSICELKNLYWSQGSSHALTQIIDITDEFLGQRLTSVSPNKNWYELGIQSHRPLASFDVIFMRKEPPFDMNYIYATYMLDHAESNHTLVVNRPNSLRDCNEKFYTTDFSEFAPPMLVTQDQTRLLEFHDEHRDVVYKPLDGMGGKGIFRVSENDHNVNVVIETLTQNGTTPIMAQLYLPEISQGDKRILLIDGEPIPYALARIPTGRDFRGNLATGGQGVVQPLTERELEVCRAIGPDFQRRGLIFVGIDMIGSYLTEINVTCPTCAREIDREAGTNIGHTLLTAISNRLPEQTSSSV